MARAVLGNLICTREKPVAGIVGRDTIGANKSAVRGAKVGSHKRERIEQDGCAGGCGFPEVDERQRWLTHDG